MLSITPQQVMPALRALFDPDQPTVPRALLVLDSTVPGTILCGDPDRPRWAAIYEQPFATVYLAGAVEQAVVEQIMAHLRTSGDVLVGCLPDDPLLTLLPPDPVYDGWALYYPQRDRTVDLAALLQHVPPGCDLRLRDHALFERSLDRDDTLRALGSVDAVLAKTHGVFMMRGDEILCEAGTSPATSGRIEVGVTAHEGHRRQGYATLACACLIQHCEEAGYETWWDCAAQNSASTALAHKLGYRQGTQYRVIMWERMPHNM